MRNRYEKLVHEFHRAFGVPSREEIEDGALNKHVSDDEFELRRNVVSEEVSETQDGILRERRVDIADGLADTLFTVAGSTIQLGCTMDKALKAAAVDMLHICIGSFKRATHEKNKPDIERAAGMFRIVCHGIAAAYDIPLDKVFDEVARSNMTKLEHPHHSDCAMYNAPAEAAAPCNCGAVRYREDGKVIKPTTYSPARVEAILEEYGQPWQA